jgi:hypothetical protein
MVQKPCYLHETAVGGVMQGRQPPAIFSIWVSTLAQQDANRLSPTWRWGKLVIEDLLKHKFQKIQNSQYATFIVVVVD